jgi:hypothetical protein
VIIYPRRLINQLFLTAIASASLQRTSIAQIPPDSNATRNFASSLVVARDISGTWEGTFKLDSAWQLPERASAQTVSARLRFGPVGDATPTTSSSRSVHPGSFEIDFSRFGFALSTREALGWSVGADSMHAVLNPTVGHGQVEVHGAFRGDTVSGTWRYAGDAGGARGTFEIRKSADR